MDKIAQRRFASLSHGQAVPASVPRERLRTLLVVDDEEGPRQSLRLIFEDLYQVLLAENGYQAVELARRRPIDAAVIDIRMAGMSGIELLKQLKDIDAGLEVTILTAYAALETARQALRLGATDYLTKPFELHTIRETVAKMMERRALYQRTQSTVQRLKDLEREVQELRDRGDALHDRGALYGDVFHDINKPLTVIVGILSLLNRRLSNVERLEGEEMAQVRERLQTLNRQADNVIDVIQRYLGFLREDDRDSSTVSVNQVFLDLRELLRVYPGAQNRDISFVFLPEETIAKVNSTDLLQMLLNLTVNALQATPDSRLVEVAACVSDQPLGMELWRDGPTRRFVRSPGFTEQDPLVVVSVRDQGEGIAAEIVHKIFDSPVTTKPRGRGTGLGLTIVKRLVLLNRGALALQTTPGVGTTITVFLPAAEANLTGRRGLQAGPAPAGSVPC